MYGIFVASDCSKEDFTFSHNFSLTQQNFFFIRSNCDIKIFKCGNFHYLMFFYLFHCFFQRLFYSISYGSKLQIKMTSLMRKILFLFLKHLGAVDSLVGVAN